MLEISQSNPEIAEALSIKSDKNGVYVNKWYIKVRSAEVVGKVKKHFDIIDIVTKKVLVADLFLYEAALAIVRYLNTNKLLTSPEIANILFLEKKYTQSSIDALLHKRNMIKAQRDKNEEKAFYSESRYKDSLHKALKLESDIKGILKISLI
ncbi:MAG: hypothetical protein HC836_31825 [Richelia sp. RM2_1_2]|nr:hypothetical protein [Richelia sp. RM2_1_2]